MSLIYEIYNRIKPIFFNILQFGWKIRLSQSFLALFAGSSRSSVRSSSFFLFDALFSSRDSSPRNSLGELSCSVPSNLKLGFKKPYSSMLDKRSIFCPSQSSKSLNVTLIYKITLFIVNIRTGLNSA